MRIDLKWIAVLCVMLVGAIAGSYLLGVKRGSQVSHGTSAPTVSSRDVTEPAPPTRPIGGDSDPARNLPEGHPPVTPSTRQIASLRQPAEIPSGHPVESSTTESSSQAKIHPQLRYTHFRVGNRNIKAMLSDGNLIWVGTSGGVIRYDTISEEHKLFDVRSGLLSNGVFHLNKLGGKLAVGTYGGGLSLLDPDTETWENFNIQHGLADPFVYDTLEASNGDLWIATWSGANRVRGGRLDDRSSWDLFTVDNTTGGLPNDWVYGLAEGKDGVIWFATEGGLARFNNGSWDNWNHNDGLGAPFEQVKDQIEFTRDPAKLSSHHARQKVEQGLGDVDIAYNPNYIVALLVDADGVVWSGTWGGGLVRFDGETWRNYTVTDGLPANHVFMLKRGQEGAIWVGTSKGLSRFRNGEFETFTTADGLFADYVFSMATDPQGALWVGSFGGAARILGILPKS